MKQTALVLSLLFFYLSAHAQSDFREGYVITNEGDTLLGYVNYREGLKIFLVCEFRKTPSSESIEYHPEQIRAYRFKDDKLIVSRKLVLDENPPKHYFMEVLVDGSLTLYQYRDRYFVGKADSIEHELTNVRSETYINGKRMSKESGQFKGILMFMTRDCPEQKKSIETAQFNQREMTTIVENYNDCVGTSISYKAKKAWFIAIPGITSGVNSTSFSYDNDRIPSDFSNDMTYTVGVDFELKAPRVNEYFSVYTGIFYVKNKFFSYMEETPYVVVYRHEVTLEYSQVKVPITVRYTFPERNITPYFNVGFVPVFLKMTENSWRAESERNNIVYSEDVSPFTMSKKNAGLMGGIGVKKKMGNKYNLRAELRYEMFQLRGATPYVDNTKIQNFQLLFSVTL